jgi:serralysin
MKRFLVLAMAFIFFNSNLNAQFRISNRIPTTDQTVKETSVLPVERTLPSTLQTETLGHGFCTDLHADDGYIPERNFSAVVSIPKLNPDGTVSNIAVTRQKLAGETNKMWDPGQTLNVHIDPNNSTQELRNQIMKYAKEWEEIANIKFQEVSRIKEAQIKIGFGFKGHWSKLGKDALSIWVYDKTMNIEKPTSMSADDLRWVVLHEFGHALGFIHEHQSPAAGIKWDREKVYAYFAEKPNEWTREKVDMNVFQKYSRTNTNYSAYDPYSIMHYHIPSDLTTDGKGTPQNFEFSVMDKYYARLLYPFPPEPANASGILRTGDDCDEIMFKVDYNAVPKDVVEFTLMLGSSNGREVTWWKQVVVPMTMNRENKLWVQNHSLIPAENRKVISVRIPVTEIDKSKGIAFWKAKLFGVHTPLSYQWRVWESLPGGTKVTLTWNKDSCT